MSAMPDPNDFRSYNRSESRNNGDLSQDRYSQYDDSHQDSVFDPEDHQQAYYHEPYEPSPQDIPLLSRNSTHEQLYDPNGDNPPFLQYRGSRESFQSDPNTASIAANTGEAQPIKPRQIVKLFQGNVILDCPVPPKLLRTFSPTPPPSRDEFTHVRYTAATCDPSEFVDEHFTLRQPLFGQPRH